MSPSMKSGQSFKRRFLKNAMIVLCIDISGVVVYYKSAVVYLLRFNIEIRSKMSVSMGLGL